MYNIGMEEKKLLDRNQALIVQMHDVGINDRQTPETVHTNKSTATPSPPLKLQLRLCLGLVMDNAIIILPSRQRNLINQAGKSLDQ